MVNLCREEKRALLLGLRRVYVEDFPPLQGRLTRWIASRLRARPRPSPGICAMVSFGDSAVVIAVTTRAELDLRLLIVYICLQAPWISQYLCASMAQTFLAVYV